MSISKDPLASTSSSWARWVGNNGVAKFTRRYNDYGDLIEEAYFGTGGEPVLRDDGYARLTRVIDRDGHIIEEAYIGTDREPVKQKNGYAREQSPA